MHRKIARSFYFIVFFNALFFLITASLWAKPAISSKPQSHEFGTIIRGDQVSYIFQITNKGSSPLKISLVKTSCGCSAVFLEDKDIPPGGSTPLKVEFDSTEFIGKIHKTIFIYSNDPKQSEYSVSFTADVNTLINVTPDRVNMGTVELQKESQAAFPFRVSISTGTGRITGLKYNKDYFDVSCGSQKTAGENSFYDCSLTIKKGSPSGSILEEIVINTNLKKQPFYKLNIYGKLKGAFDLIPMLIDFGEVSSSETATETLSVTNTNQKPFIILKVTPDRPEITYDLSPDPENFSYDITVKFSPATLTEVVEGKIKILTDYPENPEIQIKYQAFVE